MQYDFTSSSNRKNTNSEKYKLSEEKFGTNDVEPLWIADMDLDCPSFIQDALKKRLEHPIFGYEMFPKSAFIAQINWLNQNYDTSYTINDVLNIHSVTSSINVAIEAFSNEGDNIIVQTPVYAPFFTSVKQQNREVLLNELKIDTQGYYRFDIENLKEQINDKTKLLLLCNPGNPVSRAWNKKELAEVLDICIKNNIIVFSDEVHCDLVYEPNKHTAFSTLEGASEITLSTYGIGKTFNLSGLTLASIFIQNKTIKNKFLKVYNKYHYGDGNILSHIAFESAYTNGHKWLSEVKVHLNENCKELVKVINKYPSIIKMCKVEATYLAWLDCSGMKISDKKINNFFIKEAKLGLNRGIFFGNNGRGHVRLNFAVSKEKMTKILLQLDNALANKVNLLP